MANSDEAKRAQLNVQIAQHKFKQALKKDDREAQLPSVSTESSIEFISYIEAFLRHNTAGNIQKCKEWIVRHICASKTRVAVLGDYLVSVSKSVVVTHNSKSAKKAARNRLDLLFLVSDVFHTAKLHSHQHNKQAQHGFMDSNFNSALEQLLEQVAACIRDKGSIVEKKLKALLNYWALSGLITSEDFKSLKQKADESLRLAQGGAPIRRKVYMLPEYHGDKFAPWHELPASYMLEQMIKYPNRAIDCRRIKIARLNKKPVSPQVQQLLDNYFENIDLKFTPTGENPTGETDKYKLTTDSMGQLVKCNKETDEKETVCNGYGWSMKFCQDQKKYRIPESVLEARQNLEDTRFGMKGLRNTRSPSPRRRPYSSSGSEYERDRGKHSRPGSRSSYESRDERSGTPGRYVDSWRQFSRGGSNYERGRPFDNRQNYSDQRRQPYDRESSHSRSRWNEQDNSNRGGYGSNNTTNNSYPNSSYGQAYSQAPQPPLHAPMYPIPQVNPPYTGQFGAQGPPPHTLPRAPLPPFQAPGGPGAIAPMPPSFNGQYPIPTPGMSGFQNNSSNNNYGTGYGNDAGYAHNQGNFQGGGGFGRGSQYPRGGNNAGYAQNQGNFQGGSGFGRGYQNSRGGYRGSQRGRGGSHR